MPQKLPHNSEEINFFVKILRKLLVSKMLSTGFRQNLSGVLRIVLKINNIKDNKICLKYKSPVPFQLIRTILQLRGSNK